jgi:hypothetical protein
MLSGCKDVKNNTQDEEKRMKYSRKQRKEGEKEQT